MTHGERSERYVDRATQVMMECPAMADGRRRVSSGDGGCEEATVVANKAARAVPEWPRI